MENKIDKRYHTKVEIPISIILETIFSSDNHDVETLTRWAKKYGFVDLIEKDDKKYYQLQDDYTKQSFYIWLSKEERKQYDYEDYLIDENEKLNNIIKEIRKEMENAKHISIDDSKAIIEHEKRILEMLDKENKRE